MKNRLELVVIRDDVPCNRIRNGSATHILSLQRFALARHLQIYLEFYDESV
jgi:hypothetical protein